MKFWSKRRTPIVLITFLALVAALTLYAILRIPSAAPQLPQTIYVYAFSTQRDTFTQGIFPAFEKEWQEKTEQEINIEGIFGPSGTLVGQISLGAPADVAVLSHTHHVSLLKLAGLLKSSGLVKKQSQPVLIGSSPIVIVTRAGNPKKIRDFSDLTQPELILLHADPRSSGVGAWALLAEYGSSYLKDGNEEKARQQLTDIWQNVRVMAPSADAALSLFSLGAGDAILNYEQDTLMALERGIDLEVVIPTTTILTQSAAVLIDENIEANERDLVEAFLDFLTGEKGQQILEEYHWRSPDLLLANGDGLFFSAEDLGGWSEGYKMRVFPHWEKTILPDLDLEDEGTLLQLGD